VVQMGAEPVNIVKTRGTHEDQAPGSSAGQTTDGLQLVGARCVPAQRPGLVPRGH
jgi:hypothetical protein